MTPTIPKERTPFIFGYSTILPAVWITLSTGGYVLFPGHRLGIVGTVLVFMGVAALIGLLFARRHRRQFSKPEYWRLIGYCASWAALFELFVLFTVFVLPQVEKGHVDVGPLLFAVPFTVVLDTLFIWLAFRQTGIKVIAWYLRKLESNTSSANETA